MIQETSLGLSTRIADQCKEFKDQPFNSTRLEMMRHRTKDQIPIICFLAQMAEADDKSPALGRIDIGVFICQKMAGSYYLSDGGQPKVFAVLGLWRGLSLVWDNQSDIGSYTSIYYVTLFVMLI